MKLIADIPRQLIRRRLWPLALLLVAALVAVPLTLAKSPEPLASTPAPGKRATEKPMSSFVSLDTHTGEPKRRRVLGEVKDPFAPAPLAPRRSPHAKTETTGPTATSTPAPTGSSGSGGAAPPSSPPASPTPTATPKPTVPKYSIKVRFGATDGNAVTSTLERLEPLRSADSPLLVYEGVEDGGKVAIFSIAGSVTAQGDGTCEPSPDECTTLKLKAGETEFITIADTGDAAAAPQYELDLVKIFSKRTTVQDQTSPSAQSSSQRKLTGYRFDPATGTLHRVKPRS